MRRFTLLELQAAVAAAATRSESAARSGTSGSGRSSSDVARGPTANRLFTFGGGRRSPDAETATSSTVAGVRTFMVERYVPGVNADTFAEAVHRAASAAAMLTEHGVPVRYLGSVYVPKEECSFCCFEARDAEAVREANRRAGVPFWRVVRAVFIEQ
jgi:hypothetical protein